MEPGYTSIPSPLMVSNWVHKSGGVHCSLDTVLYLIYLHYNTGVVPRHHSILGGGAQRTVGTCPPP